MEIDWIIVAAEVIIILGIMIIAAKILLVKYKKCVIEFNNKNYNYLIKNAKIVSVFSSKNTEKHYMYFMIAVSYYENGDDESFLEYINRIKHKKVINRKYFWVSIYYLLQGEEKYQEYYAQLKQSDSEEEKEYFIKRFMLCEKVIKETGEVSLDEKREIDSIQSQRLKNILLKSITNVEGSNL